jgi:hypothetical protein
MEHDLASNQDTGLILYLCRYVNHASFFQGHLRDIAHVRTRPSGTAARGR